VPSRRSPVSEKRKSAEAAQQCLDRFYLHFHKATASEIARKNL
jgi:hypothetical protein